MFTGELLVLGEQQAVYSSGATDTGVSQSDSVATLRSRGIADTASVFSDTAARVATRPRLVADTGVSQSDSVATTRTRPISDTAAAFSDTVARVAVHPRPVADTGASQSDAVTTIRNRGISTTGVSQSDSVAVIRVRSVTDTGASFSDVAATIRVRVIADTAVAFSDSVTLAVPHPRPVADTGVSQSDSVATTRNRVVSTTGASQSDTVAIQRGTNRPVADTGVTQTDTVSTRRNRVIADTAAAFTDTVKKLVAKFISDTGDSHSDSVGILRGTNRPVSDVGVSQASVVAPRILGGNTVPSGIVAPFVKPSYAGTPRFVRTTGGQKIQLLGTNVGDNAGATATQRVIDVGANIVRINVYWGDVEPTAPTGAGTTWSSYVHTYDTAGVLPQIDAIVQSCATAGVMCLLEGHQSSWGYFNGVGAHGGIPPWYYTDARFPGAAIVSSFGSGGTGLSNAQRTWWTDTANQTFYIAFWQMLVARYSQYQNVVAYGAFNEPEIGNMGGSYATKVNTVSTWLQPVVSAIYNADAVTSVNQGRAIHVMAIGGSLGDTSGDFSPLGAFSTFNGVLEAHAYFNGLSPGYPALNPGDVGFAGVGNSLSLSPGDDWYPSHAAGLNTTGTTYAGTYPNQLAFHQVLVNAAQQLGAPFFLGEFGATIDDTGAPQYEGDITRLLSQQGLSGTQWSMRPSATSGFTLMTNGTNALNQQGLILQGFLTQTDTVQILAARPGLADTGATVSDSVQKLVAKPITDTAVAQTDSVAVNKTRRVTDTGVTQSDSTSTLRARFIVDTGDVPSDTVATLRLRRVADTGDSQTDTLTTTRVRRVADTGATISDAVTTTVSGVVVLQTRTFTGIITSSPWTANVAGGGATATPTQTGAAATATVGAAAGTPTQTGATGTVTL